MDYQIFRLLVPTDNKMKTAKCGHFTWLDSAHLNGVKGMYDLLQVKPKILNTHCGSMVTAR